MPSAAASSWCSSTASQCSDADISHKRREVHAQIPGKAVLTAANPPGALGGPARKRKTAKRAVHSQKGGDEVSEFEFCRWAQEKLAGDAEERQDLLDALAGHVATMSFHPLGCRLIQYALDAGDDESRVRLAEELRGHALSACRSPHANFVLSKIAEVMPSTGLQWIFEELRGSGVVVARDNCGCRVLSSLFARPDFWQDPASAAEGLICDVLGSAAELFYHPFGQHVVEAAFIHGGDRARSTIVAAMRGKCARMSKNRHASYMVQRALLVCGPLERVAIADEILGKYKTLMALCQDQFGHHVVQTALRMPGEQSSQAAMRIMAARVLLLDSQFGRKVLDEIGSILVPC